MTRITPFFCRLLACALIASASLATPTSPVHAHTLRWAAPSDALSLDPHAQNEVLSNSLNAHIYERLTSRDEKLALIPALAVGWKQVNALTWDFQLRKGVHFHDGSLLTGEDVVFSVQRAQHPASAVAQYARGLGHVSHLGNGLVRFRLDTPNPVLLDHVDAIPIMSHQWARDHGVMVPLSLKASQESYAKHHANGTGPFRLLSRQADVRTVLVRHDGYWGTVKGNVTQLDMIPIANALTRTAALTTGEVDLVTAPSPRDLNRLANTPGIVVRRTLENRVVFLGFDQFRDELTTSNIKGRNPFKDQRVRWAVAHAIDYDAIRNVLLRDQVVPTGCLLPSALTCATVPEMESRRAHYQPARSRQLLTEAGYPDGFEVALDCPNDRNVNDEVLCTALASMLAKVGIGLRVDLMPKAQFFPKLDRLESSAYLMAWGGAELDPQPTMEPLMHSWDERTGRGEVNFGRFSDATLDALIESTAIEPNPRKRLPMIREALLRHQAQAYHVPIYRQTLTWAMREGVNAQPAANNHMRAWFVTVSGN